VSAMRTLFPYTTLFRSQAVVGRHEGGGALGGQAADGRILVTPDQLAGKVEPAIRQWRGLLAQIGPVVVEGAGQAAGPREAGDVRSEEHTSELQSRGHLV